MPTDILGEVYAINATHNTSTVAVRLGGKVVRFPSDNPHDFRLGEEVLVTVTKLPQREFVIVSRDSEPDAFDYRHGEDDDE